MRWDKHGILFADVPNSGGVVGRKTGSRGGNERHDSRSGKFAVGSGANKQQVETPANIDPLAYKRQLDAVRDAARQLDTLDEAAVAEFIKGRATAPEQVDIANFLQMVTEQRKADLLDIIDTSLREGDGEDRIRVVAPEGLVAEHIRALGTAAVGEIMERLEAMGHPAEKVKKFFDSRLEAVEEAEKKVSDGR